MISSEVITGNTINWKVPEGFGPKELRGRT
jgi:hypothetical protein